MDTKKIFKRIDFRLLSSEIKDYGYTYSFKSFVSQLIFIIAIIVGISYFLNLQPLHIMIVIIVSIVSLPTIIIAQYRQLYNAKRFKQLQDYLEYMIFNFKSNPNILESLKGTKELVNGEIAIAIDKAIDVIENDTQTENVYGKALGIIEQEYPSSRIKSLHEIMIKISKQSTENYRQILDNLYIDIEAFINRTLVFQEELRDKRNDITGSIIFANILIAIISYMYRTIDLFSSMLTDPMYQMAICIILIISVVGYTGSQIMLHGQWLVNDMNSISYDRVLKDIEFVEKYDAVKEHKKAIISVVLLLPIVAFSVYVKNNMIMFVSVLACFYMYTNSKAIYKTKKKCIADCINKDFPRWLREISLNINTVLPYTAIKNSIDQASPVMQHFLSRFIEEIDEDPMSLKPYLYFLKEYDESTDKLNVIECMKTLYSMRFLPKKEMSQQINSLIIRNQKLLDYTEDLANKNTLKIVKTLSKIPNGLIGGKLVVDIFLVFSSMGNLTAVVK